MARNTPTESMHPIRALATVIRLRLHRWVRSVGLVDDDFDERFLCDCEECGELRAMAVATVQPTDKDYHDVVEVALDCGHVAEDPDFRIADPVVELILVDRPDVLEIVDGGPR